MNALVMIFLLGSFVLADEPQIIGRMNAEQLETALAKFEEDRALTTGFSAIDGLANLLLVDLRDADLSRLADDELAAGLTAYGRLLALAIRTRVFQAPVKHSLRDHLTAIVYGLGEPDFGADDPIYGFIVWERVNSYRLGPKSRQAREGASRLIGAALQEAIENSGEWKVRVRALSALKSLGSAVATPILVDLAESQDAQMKLAVIDALSNWAKLEDPGAFVRACAQILVAKR